MGGHEGCLRKGFGWGVRGRAFWWETNDTSVKRGTLSGEEDDEGIPTGLVRLVRGPREATVDSRSP